MQNAHHVHTKTKVSPFQTFLLMIASLATGKSFKVQVAEAITFVQGMDLSGFDPRPVLSVLETMVEQARMKGTMAENMKTVKVRVHRAYRTWITGLSAEWREFADFIEFQIEHKSCSPDLLVTHLASEIIGIDTISLQADIDEDARIAVATRLSQLCTDHPFEGSRDLVIEVATHLAVEHLITLPAESGQLELEPTTASSKSDDTNGPTDDVSDAPAVTASSADSDGAESPDDVSSEGQRTEGIGTNGTGKPIPGAGSAEHREQANA